MKKILYLLLAVFLLGACAPKETHKTMPIDKGDYIDYVPLYTADEYLSTAIDGNNVNVVVIDSCEYIVVWTYDGHMYMTHKGNCTHCKEVREKELDALYEKLTHQNNGSTTEYFY